MALPGYPKTYETPKIHIGHQATGSDVTVDAKCEMIKCTGSGADPTASHAGFQIWYYGEDKTSAGHVVELGAGDILEGPFIKVLFDKSESAGADTEGYIYERSSIVTD